MVAGRFAASRSRLALGRGRRVAAGGPRASVGRDPPRSGRPRAGGRRAAVSEASRPSRAAWRSGGVVLFGAFDTVYGLACDPGHDRFAVRAASTLRSNVDDRQAFSGHVLRSRAGARGAARARRADPVGAGASCCPAACTRAATQPGAPVPARLRRGSGTLGLRVPRFALLAGVRRPVLQSSANRAGGADPRRLDDVPEPFRAAAELVIDGGSCPGRRRRWSICAVRGRRARGPWSGQGAVEERELDEALGWQYHFDPATYAEMIRTDVPAYDRSRTSSPARAGNRARADPRARDRNRRDGPPSPGTPPGGSLGGDRHEREDARPPRGRRCRPTVSSSASRAGRTSCPRGSSISSPAHCACTTSRPTRSRICSLGSARCWHRRAFRARRRGHPGRSGRQESRSDPGLRPSKPARRPAQVADRGRIRRPCGLVTRRSGGACG